MAEDQPPGWDNDPLSKYFADAEHNERVTAVNYPDVYRLLRLVQGAFELAERGSPKCAGPRPSTSTVSAGPCALGISGHCASGYERSVHRSTGCSSIEH